MRKKIAIIFAIGFDGSGASTYGLQLYKELSKNHDVDIYKNVKQSNFQIKTNYGNLYNSIDFDQNNIDGLDLSNYDIIFSIIIPTKTFGLEFAQQYQNLIKRTKAIKVLIQLTHSIRSIYTCPLWKQTTELFDKLVTFSKDSKFINYKKEWLTKFIPLYNALDLSPLIKYKKDKQNYELTSIGRYAGIKDSPRIKHIFNLHKDNDLAYKIIGITRTISALKMFYDNFEKDQKINSKVIYKYSLLSKKQYDKYRNQFELAYDYMPCYGGYNKEYGLDICSQSLFACDFFNVPNNATGSSMQFMQAEIIAIGCIPVFDYDWSKECKLIIDGEQSQTSYGDIDYSGIFIKKDLSNLDQCLKLMQEIRNDKALQLKYKNTAYKLVEQHFNPSKIYNNLLRQCLK